MKGLKLRKYYFECGVLFLNIMLRSSILYACETYYNLKETEIRAIERIEENYMRQLLNTTKGCPISQIYLELGQSPARFHIFKMRGLFLKYILNQEENSMILKFFKLQLENPVRGDWVSTCMQNLQDLNICLSLEEIKEMSLYTYTGLLRTKCKESAFSYLLKKRGTKGGEIRYLKLEMAEYLLPNDEFDINEQKYIYSLRNKMFNIPSNFCSRENNTSKCQCNTTEDMEHIYNCTILNNKQPEVTFEQIFSDNFSEQKGVMKRFKMNIEARNEYNYKSENEKETVKETEKETEKESVKETEKETEKPDHVIPLDPLFSNCKSIVMD